MLTVTKYKIDALICAMGRIGTGVLTVLLMPLYLPLLGEEAFGLFGLFASLELFFGIVEGGLGAVLIRDIATLEAAKKPTADFIRSFEAGYVLFGVLQTLVCLALIQVGVFSFLETETLARSTTILCLQILSLRFIWGSVSIVHNAVFAARAQLVFVNLVRLSFCLLSGLGAYVVLRLTEGNPVSFFLWWLGVTGVISLIKFSKVWWRHGVEALRARVRTRTLWSYRKSQGGLILYGLLTFLATQYAVWSVSALLPLAMAGVYAIGYRFSYSVSGALGAFTMPMMARFATAEAHGNSSDHVLLKMSEAVTIIGFVGCCYFASFSREIFLLWLGADYQYLELIATMTAYLLAAMTIQHAFYPFVQVLQAKRRLKVLWARYLFQAVFGVSLLLIALPVHGLQAVGPATLLVSAADLLIFGPILMRACGERFSFREWSLKTGGPSLLLGGGSALLFSRTLPGSEVVRVGGGALACALAIGIGLFIWNFRGRHGVGKSSSSVTDCGS